MNKNVFENFSNKNLFLFLTFFFIICISLIPSTSILGIWESYTFYYNLAPHLQKIRSFAASHD